MRMQTITSILWSLVAAGVCGAEKNLSVEAAIQKGLIAWWKLNGDCRDYSAHGNHGKNHRVNLETGAFNGRGAYIEVPHHESLALGKAEFTICAWVGTGKHMIAGCCDRANGNGKDGLTRFTSTKAGRRGKCPLSFRPSSPRTVTRTQVRFVRRRHRSKMETHRGHPERRPPDDSHQRQTRVPIVSLPRGRLRHFEQQAAWHWLW